MTGKRFSPLKSINLNTVNGLTLKWANTSITTGCGPDGTGPAAAGGRGAGGGGRGGAGLIVAGLGNGESNTCGPARFGGAMLFVDNTIYAATRDDVYSIDAHDGSVLWHYYWKFRGGTSTGTRGPSMWHNYIYFTFHDDYVVCLDAKTGKEVWKKEIAPFDQQYFSSNVPLVIGNHILVGPGNDMDAPAWLQSLDPETGAIQWTHYNTPQNPGDPGPRPGKISMPRVTGQAPAGFQAPTIPIRISISTARAIPPRLTRPGAATATIFSLHASSRSTWTRARCSGTSRPRLTTRMTGIPPRRRSLPTCHLTGATRKLVMMATRNGYFYVLDRVTGEHLITSKLGLVNNYASDIGTDSKLHLDARGQVQRNPHKDASVAGSVVNDDVLNHQPPTFSPDTGLFYVHETNSLRIDYLLEPDARGSMGLGGESSAAGMNYGTFIDAIDYRTGKVVWRHQLSSGNVGLLSTAGGLLFTNDGQNFAAWDAKTGTPVWHTQIGGLSAPAETFMLDGKQVILASAGTGLYMFQMNQ